MSRRSKIMIAVVVLLLLLLLAALFLLRPAPTAVPPEDAGAGNANGPRGGLSVNYSTGSFNANVSQPPAPAPAPAPKPDERNNLRATAKSFAELYGSFSTEGNYQNLVDAEFYMSPSLKTWTDSYVAEQRSKPPSSTFFGTTTRAINVEITAFDQAGGTASVTVKTQRRESGSTATSQVVYYQDLKLTFLKAADAWKVDTATWVPR